MINSDKRTKIWVNQHQIDPRSTYSNNQHTWSQAYFGGQLTRILDKVFQPTAVKYLLLLQTGGGEAASPHRRWVQAVCGRLLSGRLIKEGGVLNVMRAVVEAAASGAEAEYEARKFEVVAEVIASPPATTYQGGHSVPL